MRVLAFVHKFPPVHNAGAEWYLHACLKYLQAAGHEILIMVKGSTGYEFDGLTVVPMASDPGRVFAEWDVIVTHLDLTRRASADARRARKPLVHIVHNDRQLRFHEVSADRTPLVVFNSVWLSELQQWPGRSIIVTPPVRVSDYSGPRGDSLTLLNLTEAKGGVILVKLADRMPERKFIGVRGAYGHQLASPRRNITYLDNTPTVKDIYRQTRVLLMPSEYESWGRVGIEAACSGIPTIAHPTPGLVESLAYAGNFANRDDLAAWEAMMLRLDDPDYYRERSERAKQRAVELELHSVRELKTLEEELCRVASCS